MHRDKSIVPVSLEELAIQSDFYMKVRIEPKSPIWWDDQIIDSKSVITFTKRMYSYRGILKFHRDEVLIAYRISNLFFFHLFAAS